jgi:branched-subunit amino acid aminotransferase/4-amino-4-deoxychorismate lyase
LTEFSEESVKTSLLEIISKNEITNARARITFFDESASGVWNFETNKKRSLLITTGDLRKISKDFRLTISPFLVNSTSPLVGVKSCNYLENILALDDAKVKGFDEAIRLNERGEVASACMANIFWIKDEKIFTSDLETGCLKGTTRSLIVENFPVEEIF